MKQAYQDGKFRAASLKLIERINDVINDPEYRGYTMTVRQLYYQLVARGIIENTIRSYKNTTDLVNNARLAGLIDWSAIVDPTREFNIRSSWTSPDAILRSAASGYHQDLWAGQKTRLFVIVEKEALAGVLNRVCYPMDLPLLAARGYPSSTVLREFCIDNIASALEENQDVVVLHLGDHDPSGIDMSRDLTERIAMFTEIDHHRVLFKRVALSMDQIREVKPPPNPAKQTDSRFADYSRLYGDSSWELDALSPSYINKLVRTEAETYIDQDILMATRDEIQSVREKIEKFAEKFDDFDVDEIE